MNSLQREIKALVTGAAGFIGSNLVDEVANYVKYLYLVDDLSSGAVSNLIDFGEALTEADVAAAPLDIEATWVFHLAAQIDVRESVLDPANDAHVNIRGTINVVKDAVDKGADAIIFASTGGALYGDSAPLPTPETAPAEPSSPYGLAKHSAERYMMLLTQGTRTRAVSLALANVFGPRQTPDGEAGVVSVFLSRMLKNLPTTIYGDGSQTRDFVFVGDVVQAFVSAARTETASGRYNIGTGVEVSVLELWERCAKLTGYTQSPNFEAPRPGELQRSCLDASRARAELGWSPSVSLEEGLGRTAEWIKQAQL